SALAASTIAWKVSDRPALTGGAAGTLAAAGAAGLAADWGCAAGVGPHAMKRRVSNSPSAELRAERDERGMLFASSTTAERGRVVPRGHSFDRRRQIVRVAPRREWFAFRERLQLARPELAHQDHAPVRGAQPLEVDVANRPLAHLGDVVLD